MSSILRSTLGFEQISPSARLNGLATDRTWKRGFPFFAVPSPYFLGQSNLSPTIGRLVRLGLGSAARSVLPACSGLGIAILCGPGQIFSSSSYHSTVANVVSEDSFFNCFLPLLCLRPFTALLLSPCRPSVRFKASHASRCPLF